MVSAAVLRWQICVVVVLSAPARLDGLPDLPGVEHHWMDVRSGRGPVRLHLAATGSGTPVLLLHGWPQHWWCWRRVVKQLSGHYRLLIPDLRGFGWSEAPGSGYSPTGFADDAVALLDALDLARVHVIGHDWGGFAGFLLGLHHPDRVDRLLLCNSPGPWARLSPGPRLDCGGPGMRGWSRPRSWAQHVVAYPGFIPWFLRLGGQWNCFLTRMRLCMPTNSMIAPALRLARSCTGPTGGWRRRFCCDVHSRVSGCRLRHRYCSGQ